MKIYDYNGRKNLCGNRVKEARARLNITQADLAARLQVAGVTMERDSVSRIEIGTRFVTDYELSVLSDVFCCLHFTMDFRKNLQKCALAAGELNG